jgi:hypothetical protein
MNIIRAPNYHNNEIIFQCNVSLIYCTLRFVDVRTDRMKYALFTLVHFPIPYFDMPFTSDSTSSGVQWLLFFLCVHNLLTLAEHRLFLSKKDGFCQTVKNSHEISLHYNRWYVNNSESALNIHSVFSLIMMNNN